MAKMGRPRAQIDRKTFEGLCAIQASEKEICMVLGKSVFQPLDPKTLNRWCKETYNGMTFSYVKEQMAAVGKIALRRYQLELAKKSAAMAIFLGKNWLKQSDNPNAPQDVATGPIIITGEENIKD